MFFMFSASRVPWVVKRTSSPPASMMRLAWATLPSVSLVSVVAIDWMRMGFWPPMAMLPTWATLLIRLVLILHRC